MLVIVSEETGALQARVVYGQGVYQKCVGVSNPVTIYGLKPATPISSTRVWQLCTKKY